VAIVLTAVALLPAAVVGRVFGGWDRIPPVAQWAVIGIGAACTAVVVYLIFTAESEEGP
jgi:flagellar biosynthesis/type III secretory pathway M-ring protein FliF/YscJ